MTDRTGLPRPLPTRGPRHLIASAIHSMGGARRLWRETAFRHELAGGAAGLVLLIAVQASPAEIAGAAILFLLLAATEALNTAIEVIVDHLTPHWAEFARDAKDLGSFAVLCMILANVLYLGYVVLI